MAERLADVGERAAARHRQHGEAASLLDEQVVENGHGRTAYGGRRGVERHGVETLPLGVEKMPGRQVAAEEAALDEPADFPCGEVDSADPRGVDRRSERGEQHPPPTGNLVGPPVAEHAGVAIGGRQPCQVGALGGHAEEPVGVDRRQHDRAVVEPGRAARAARLADADRAAPRGRDLHHLSPCDEAERAAIGREEGRLAVFGAFDPFGVPLAELAPVDRSPTLLHHGEHQAAPVGRKGQQGVAADGQFLVVGKMDGQALRLARRRAVFAREAGEKGGAGDRDEETGEPGQVSSPGRARLRSPNRCPPLVDVDACQYVLERDPRVGDVVQPPFRVAFEAAAQELPDHPRCAGGRRPRSISLRITAERVSTTLSPSNRRSPVSIS